jgi:hypothetical protein
MSNIVIPDGGNIGSASDTDAISIAANGKPTFSAGIANTGTIDAGTLGSSVVFPAVVIIGVENTTTTTIVERTSTTYADIISDSITVKAGSKCLINVSIPVSSSGSSSPAGGQILQTGTASATIMAETEIMDEHHASSGGYFGGTFLSGVLSSAGSYTFTFQGNRLSGSSPVYFVSANPGSGSASIATMTLYEVAQ